MAIRFPDDRRGAVVAAIRRYFADELGEEIGDLQATLLLDFLLREIGPSIYNQAITDAQAWMLERVTDLDASLYEPEPTPTRSRRDREDPR